MAILTNISQAEVKILTAKDYDGYEANRPGPQWELVEYKDIKDRDGKPLRVWAGKHTLRYPKFTDMSKLTIVEADNG